VVSITKIVGGNPIVDAQGKPKDSFLTPLNNSLKSLESALNQLLAIPAIQEALDDLDTAITAANAAAANAQAAADTVTAESSLATSYATGLTIDAASTGIVTISAHTRVYGNGDSVPVNGGSVNTGLTNPAVARIYYDQPSRAGGAVTYLSTTSITAAAQTGDRHSVGAVEIPAAGTQAGNPVRPPGYAEP
jgi:cell wall-associated NlpC family hydrolase